VNNQACLEWYLANIWLDFSVVKPYGIDQVGKETEVGVTLDINRHKSVVQLGALVLVQKDML
jgi:hypothetical protein